jgi:hypothetical protein
VAGCQNACLEKRRLVPGIKSKGCSRREERIMVFFRPRPLILATMFCLSLSFLAVSVKRSLGQDQAPATEIKPKLTEEEMRQFLLTAKIIRSHGTPKGVTRPSRLTLSDGKLTQDAGFQSIDEFKSFERFDDGHTEINFRDTYHYNIAAYELAKLLGMESMMPVTVERKWKGKKGSLSWWLDAKMDEGERLQKNIPVPDVEAWNRQMYKKRVFAELVYDTDPNLTNLLIGENWEVYMIDFSRAFRLQENLARPADLVRCDRQLLEKLRKLDEAEVERVTKPHLEKVRIKALMKRRDKIVARFEQLIKEKGEEAVLY